MGRFKSGIFILFTLVSFVLVACQSSRLSSSEKSLGIFEFHNSVWMNLHHYLYNEAFRPQTHQEPTTPFSFSEKETINRGILFYRNKFKEKDLLFDKDLRQIAIKLSRAENSKSLKDIELDSDLKSELESAKEIYQEKIWPEQKKKNHQWIEDVRRQLGRFGKQIKERLKVVLKRNFSDGPYRIDVVNEANWAGGYTFSFPAHSIVSSGKPSPSDWAPLELIFHETLHAGPFDVIYDAMEKEFKKRNLEDKDKLWHAIHFFTVGEVVEEILKQSGIEYTPYASAKGLFSADRTWGKYENLLKRFWLPYIQGKTEMSVALTEIFNQVGKDEKRTSHEK